MPAKQDLETMAEAGFMDLFMKYASVPDIICAAFYTESGLDPNDHYTSAAQTSADEVEEVISIIIAAGVRVPLASKVKVRHAFQIMRRAADQPPSIISPASLAPPYSSTGGPTTTTSTPPPVFQIKAQNVELEPGQLAASDLVAFSETVLQSSDVKVKRLTPKMVKDAARAYKESERIDPPEDEAIAEEQLTALYALVTHMCTTFVDFCIWVPH